MMKILYELCEVPCFHETNARFNGYIWIPQKHVWFLSQDDIDKMYGGCYAEVGDSFNSMVDVEITHCRHDVHGGETYLVLGFDTLHLYDEKRIANLYSGDGAAYSRALLYKMLGFALVAANDAVISVNIEP